MIQANTGILKRWNITNMLTSFQYNDWVLIMPNVNNINMFMWCQQGMLWRVVGGTGCLLRCSEDMAWRYIVVLVRRITKRESTALLVHTTTRFCAKVPFWYVRLQHTSIFSHQTHIDTSQGGSALCLRKVEGSILGNGVNWGTKVRSWSRQVYRIFII